MTGVKPPKAIKAAGYRRMYVACRAQMMADGSWNGAVEPLLENYVVGLERAERFRDEALAAPFRESKGRTYLHPAFVAADRTLKLALNTADALGLTPMSRKRLGLAKLRAQPDPNDPLSVIDEIAARREAEKRGAS